MVCFLPLKPPDPYLLYHLKSYDGIGLSPFTLPLITNRRLIWSARNLMERPPRQNGLFAQSARRWRLMAFAMLGGLHLALGNLLSLVKAYHHKVRQLALLFSQRSMPGTQKQPRDSGLQPGLLSQTSPGRAGPSGLSPSWRGFPFLDPSRPQPPPGVA